MLLSSITKNSAIFTDENMDETSLLNLANRGISRINNECKTLFPKYTGLTVDYTAIPEDWQMDLLSPYMSWGIKMNDTSLNEADRYLKEFNDNVISFRANIGRLVQNYANGDIVNGISGDYVDANGFGGAYAMDTSRAVQNGWWNGNGNAGSY